jgi:hypothetical protein
MHIPDAVLAFLHAQVLNAFKRQVEFRTGDEGIPYRQTNCFR